MNQNKKSNNFKGITQQRNKTPSIPNVFKCSKSHYSEIISKQIKNVSKRKSYSISQENNNNHGNDKYLRILITDMKTEIKKTKKFLINQISSTNKKHIDMINKKYELISNKIALLEKKHHKYYIEPENDKTNNEKYSRYKNIIKSSYSNKMNLEYEKGIIEFKDLMKNIKEEQFKDISIYKKLKEINMLFSSRRNNISSLISSYERNSELNIKLELSKDNEITNFINYEN